MKPGDTIWPCTSIIRVAVRPASLPIEEARHAADAGALREFVERRVAFAQGDYLLVVGERGKQIAEPPDSAEVDGRLRKLTLAPSRFQ